MHNFYFILLSSCVLFLLGVWLFVLSMFSGFFAAIVCLFVCLFCCDFCLKAGSSFEPLTGFELEASLLRWLLGGAALCGMGITLLELPLTVPS